VAGAAILAVLTLAGCGGDDEPSDTASKPPPRTNTGTDRSEPGKPAPPPKTDTAVPKTTPSPGETQPGGAGDEEPARSQALLTGRAGRIAPRVVRVPPYISIRVELRSADGRTYELRFGRRLIRAGGQVSSASAAFPGLRPGKTLVGRPGGAGNAVRIEANAEPGP
jgi:hypothetical protein